MEQADAEARKARAIHGFGEIAEVYDQHGPTYFSAFGRRLVEIVGVRAGARVLDVATGRGAVLYPALAAVGEQGSVVGIDLAEPMVRATNVELTSRGVSNALARVMDAEDLDFPAASFDVVLCGFGLMFLPHLDQALRGFRRVLVLAGKLGVSTWASGMNSAIAPILEAYRPASGRTMAHELAAEDELRGALLQAEFARVEVCREALEVVYADAEAYWSWMSSLMVGVWYQTLTVETQGAFKADVFAHLAETRQADGIHEQLTALLAVGEAA